MLCSCHACCCTCCAQAVLMLCVLCPCLVYAAKAVLITLHSNSDDHVCAVVCVDRRQEHIRHVLDPSTRIRGFLGACYWCSGPSDDADSTETLDFRLAHPLCVVRDIIVQPYGAAFQPVSTCLSKNSLSGSVTYCCSTGPDSCLQYTDVTRPGHPGKSEHDRAYMKWFIFARVVLAGLFQLRIVRVFGRSSVSSYNLTVNIAGLPMPAAMRTLPQQLANFSSLSVLAHKQGWHGAILPCCCLLIFSPCVGWAACLLPL